MTNTFFYFALPFGSYLYKKEIIKYLVKIYYVYLSIYSYTFDYKLSIYFILLAECKYVEYV